MKTDPAATASILLVDDNTHGLVARGLILKELGHTVVTATSGEEAWDLFQKNHFDIVVTDFRMGGMDGLQLIRLIRGTESPARIILLTGFVNCLGMPDAETGADEVIAKSSKEVQELLRAVRKLAHTPPRRQAGSARRTAAVRKSKHA